VAIAPVGGQTAQNVSATTSVVGTFPSTPTPGSLLIAEVGAAGNGTQPSVSDSEGAWTLMVYNQEAATTRSVSIWAKIASGSQPTAITASRTGATAMWINLSEWSGASSSLTGAVNSVDGSNGLSVTGAAITTTDAGSMVVAACLSSGPMTAPGESGPFTVSQTNPATPNTRLIDAYHIPGSIGTYTPTFTWTTTNRTSSVATAEFFPAASSTPKSDTDTGVGTEASAIAISLSDTGAGSDTSAIRITASDAGSGADASSVSSPVSVSDSGTGSDTSVIAYALFGSDSGTGADASVISAALSSTDTGAGADTGTSGNPVSGADTGVGTDASVISAVLSSSDSGAGADTSRIFLVASDSGAGSEASAVGLSFIVTDSGTGVDASIGRASFIVSDSGAGSDSGGTPITGTDSGVGSDNLPRKAAGGLALLFGDSGVWGFISPVTVRLSPVDVGVGTDVTFLKVVHSDAGAAVEITGLARALSEAITSVESSTLVAAVSATENGIGTDTAILTVAASVSDSGSGTDSLALSRIVNDAASGTEAQSISLSLSDAGSFVDQLSVFTRTVSDSIFSLEGSLVTLDAPGFFISNDGGSTTENATVIAVNSVTDAGTGSDASSLASVLFAQDSGLGIENQSYKAVNLDSDFGFSEDDSTLTARFVLADSGTDTENFSKGMLVADVGSISETVNMGLVASEFGLAEDETGLFREVFDFGAGFADENISQLVEDLGYEDDLGFILYNIGGPGTGRRPNIVKTKDRAKLASAN